MIYEVYTYVTSYPTSTVPSGYTDDYPDTRNFVGYGITLFRAVNSRLNLSICTLSAVQAQTHEFNTPYQLAHPDHVPETDVPDDGQVNP